MLANSPVITASSSHASPSSLQYATSRPMLASSPRRLVPFPRRHSHSSTSPITIASMAPSTPDSHGRPAQPLAAVEPIPSNAASSLASINNITSKPTSTPKVLRPTVLSTSAPSPSTPAAAIPISSHPTAPSPKSIDPRNGHPRPQGDTHHLSPVVSNQHPSSPSLAVSSHAPASISQKVHNSTLSPGKRPGSPVLRVSDGDPLSPSQNVPVSPPKRARPENSPPKVLPLRYELCAVEDMAMLIAHMLSELIETNDSLALRSGSLTRFHSRTAPGISVLDYLNRLAKHATLTPPLLLSMVYYIDRLCALYPEFTINTLTVHRFLITAATVAAKGLSDSFWNNSTYAKVGGVRVAELKLLELEFLYRVDWRIVPNPEVLVAYYKGLVERCPGFVLEGVGDNEGKDGEDTSDLESDNSDVSDLSDGDSATAEATAESTPSGASSKPAS